MRERRIEAERDRFWAKVDQSGDCWLWTAATSAKGYGQFRASRGASQVAAHRYAYMDLVGPIPDGLALDHLCRVRNCVNPAHLEPVTTAENNLRSLPYRPPSIRSKKTHCVNGHEFTPENTVQRTRPNGRVNRDCRTCKARRTLESTRRSRARARVA